MNRLLHIFLFALIVTAPHWAQSQDFRLLASQDGERMLLKAAPVSLSSWEGWKHHGILVERRESGSQQPFERLNEELLTAPDEEELRSGNADTEVVDAIVHLLEESNSISAPTSIDEMVKADKRMRYSHGFYLLLSSIDPEASRLSGIQLTTQYQPGSYDYRLSIEEADLDTVITLNHNQLSSNPEAPQLNAVKSEKAVILHWNHQPYFRTFLAYDVERKSENGDWEKLNEAKIFYTREGTQKSPYTYRMQHVDSVKNYASHDYRLVPTDYFGESTDPSAPVTAYGIDRTAPGTVRNLKSELQDDGSATLEWDFFGDSLDLDAFMVLRSNNGIKGKYEKVHEEPLPKDTRTYRDTTIDLKETYYYRVMNADTAKNYNLSQPEYLLIPDTFPPPRPVKLGARIDSSGKVLLSWKQSEADDIEGYKVFRGDRRDFDYVQVSKGAIKANGFLDSLNLKSMDPHVFYYVIAMDQNYNHSPTSDTLKVSRPDVIAPSPPVLHTLNQENQVISLEWHPTPAPDLAGYYIEAKSGEEWSAVDSTDANSSSIDIDAGQFEEPTSLRVIAYDLHGLRSDVMNTKRYVPMEDSSSGPGRPNLDFNEDEEQVRLTWPDEDDPHRILIYRGEADKAIRLYRSTSGESQAFRDMAISSGTTYRYQIAYQQPSGEISERSEENTIEVP